MNCLNVVFNYTQLLTAMFPTIRAIYIIG